MGPAAVESVDCSLHHVRRRVEIGLADLQMDDAFALPFQCPRLIQDFKSSFGAQARHTAGQ